jgi:hypothetical protein
MYTISYEAIIKGFPKTIKPPVELEKLVKWANENEHKMGGSFELYADEEGKCLEYWSQSTYLNDHFAQFGVGPSGAPTGIWRDDEGRERIVYLFDEERWGDVIAESFLDYLRILAIGYDDVNESCNLDIQAYNKLCEREDLNQGHNPAFKAWVEKEFNTIVPATGDEVFIKERDSFNVWLNKSIRKHGIEHLAEYPLFEQIGKDLRTSWLYAGVFLSLPLGKVGKTYFTIKNYYGIKAILNEDYTIRHLILGGYHPKLNSYRHENPAALESLDTREVVERSLGKPIKKGQKDKCEYYLYEINSKFGLRTLQIFFNPDKEKDNLWKIIIK